MIAFMEDVGGGSESSNLFGVERDGEFIRINEPVTGIQGEGTLTQHEAINLAVWLLVKVDPDKMKIMKLLDWISEKEKGK